MYASALPTQIVSINMTACPHSTSKTHRINRHVMSTLLLSCISSWLQMSQRWGVAVYIPKSGGQRSRERWVNGWPPVGGFPHTHQTFGANWRGCLLVHCYKKETRKKKENKLYSRTNHIRSCYKGLSCNVIKLLRVIWGWYLTARGSSWFTWLSFAIKALFLHFAVCTD